MRQDVGCDLPSLSPARLLVEAVVDPAIHSRIVYVVAYLREVGVVQQDVRQARTRQGDVMACRAEDCLGYLAGGVARTSVGRRIAREAGCGDERCPVQVWLGTRIAVASTSPDRGDGAPGGIGVFGFHRRSQTV